KKINGTSVDLFYRFNDLFYLVQVNIFSDDSLQIARLETPLNLTIEEFENYITEGTLLTNITIGATVYIYGLGNFLIAEELYSSSIQDKLLEIKDIQKKLRGEPTSIAICQQAHRDYLENPIKSTQEKL